MVILSPILNGFANTNKRSVRVRFELDKVIDFESFKKDLNIYLLTKKDIIEQNPLPIIRIIDLSLTSYFVAVEVFTPSIFEDPVRDIVLSYVLKRQSEILSKPLLK